MGDLLGTDRFDPDFVKLLMSMWKPGFRAVHYLDQFRVHNRTVLAKVDFVYEELFRCRLLPVYVDDWKDDEDAEIWCEKATSRQPEGPQHHPNGVLAMLNKALTMAESADLLSDIYATRSAILFKAKLYDQCIADVDRAMELRCESLERNKLVQRRRDALAKKRPPRMYHAPLPEIPAGERNPAIPCASRTIRLADDAYGRYGVHVVAREALRPGQLLAVEKPYVTSVIWREKRMFHTDHCNLCGELCYSLIPCQSCTYLLYCSETCKNEAWEQYHKYECNIYHSLLTSMSPTFEQYFLLALRMAFRLRDRYTKIDDPNNPCDFSDKFESSDLEILTLEDNHAYAMPDRIYTVAMGVAKIYYLVKNHTMFFKEAPKDRPEHVFKELLFRLVFVASNNKLTIGSGFNAITSQEECHAVGIYPLMGLISHACLPNVSVVNYGNTAVLEAIAPIAAGEPLFLVTKEYTPPATNAQKTKDGMWYGGYGVFVNHHFVCTCTCCQFEVLNVGDVYSEYQSDMAKLWELLLKAHFDRPRARRLVELYARKMDDYKDKEMHLFLRKCITECLRLQGNEKSFGPSLNVLRRTIDFRPA